MFFCKLGQASWAGTGCNEIQCTHLSKLTCLEEPPAVAATLVVPYWPAQAWFQQLVELAVSVDTQELQTVAVPPGWLHGSARTALTGAMLSCIRVVGRLDGLSSRVIAAA